MKFERIMSSDGCGITYRQTGCNSRKPSACVPSCCRFPLCPPVCQPYCPPPTCPFLCPDEPEEPPPCSFDTENLPPARLSNSVRQAIVRIACKSLSSSDDDVQEEINKLKAANVLPADFQLSKCQEDQDGVDDTQADENKLKECARQLVESIIAKVQQQLENERDADGEEEGQGQTDADATKSKNGSRRRSRGTDSDKDDRQRVLECGLEILDEQTNALVCDLKRVSDEIAVKMVTEVGNGGGSYSDVSQTSNTRKSIQVEMSPNGRKNGSRASANASSIGNSNKAKPKNSKTAGKNMSSNAITIDTSDPDGEMQSEDTEDEEETDSDEDAWDVVERQNKNASRRKKSSRCRLPLNRNCNAATESDSVCCSYGSCGGCSGNRAASCNVQDVLDRETLCRALEACDNSKMPLSEHDLRAFALDVVQSLYAAVRAKLSTMLDEEYADAGGGEQPFPKDELLAKADEEVRAQVLPVVVDHIVWLMKEERRALGQLDCDMMMIAFAGQFVDTIVTNAVLKTQVDLSGKRANARTFVATSNGGRNSFGSRLGSGSVSGGGGGSGGVSSEFLKKIWNPSSIDENTSNSNNNCNEMSRSQRADEDVVVVRLYNNHNKHNNNNNHCGDVSSDLNEDNRHHSTAHVFLNGYWLPEHVCCCAYKNSSWNDSAGNYDTCNYTSSSSCARRSGEERDFSDGVNYATDAAAAADDVDLMRCLDDDDDDDDRGDCLIISQDRVTQDTASDDDKTGLVSRVKSGGKQPGSMPLHQGSALNNEQRLQDYLSTTVNNLVSTLRSQQAADRALDLAADWLSCCRASVDSLQLPHHHGRNARSWVSAGRALLNRTSFDTACRSTVDRVARILFQRAVNAAVGATTLDDVPDYDAQVSLIVRVERLWHEAIRTSELMLMKTAIQANFRELYQQASCSFHSQGDQFDNAVITNGREWFDQLCEEGKIKDSCSM